MQLETITLFETMLSGNSWWSSSPVKRWKEGGSVRASSVVWVGRETNVWHYTTIPPPPPVVAVVLEEEEGSPFGKFLSFLPPLRLGQLLFGQLKRFSPSSSLPLSTAEK